MNGAEIVAYGRYLPKEILDNEFFISKNPYKIYTGRDSDGNPIFDEKKVWLTNEKILTNTGGIRERRRAAPDETIDSFVERAFLNTNFPAGELTGILIATVTDSVLFPSVSCRVQQRIGAKKRGIYTADIIAACSGFTHALDYARLKVQEEEGYWLVAGVDLLTRITDYEEVNCDLFGDGCGVVIVGPTKNTNSGILATCFDSQSEGLDYIYKDKLEKLRMPQGPKVFTKATRGMIDIAHRLIDKIGLSKNDIKLYIPHQANGRIVDYFEQKEDPERTGKIYRNIERYANMSGATVPVALSEAIEEKKIKKGEAVILTDVGSGLVLGGALIRI